MCDCVIQLAYYALLWHVLVYHYHDICHQGVEEPQPLHVSMTIGFNVSCQLEYIKSCNHTLQLW